MALEMLSVAGVERPIQPAAGMLLAGYRLERRLGEGGMSEVWAALDLERQRTVALKMLLPQAHANAEIVVRFRREAELLGRIDSDHVPRLYAFLEQREGCILVEEFVDGQLLAELLEKRPLDVEEAIALGTGLARALVELHRAGILHRDLKPGNVILRPQADGGHRAVLIDLGVSRLALWSEQEDTEALTKITHVERALGTIAYMAPEQFVASSNVGETVDLYALGAILFRAVAGHHVFAGLQELQVARAKLVRDAQRLETRREDQVARSFEDLVGRLLRREPDERYRSADELLAELLMLGQGIAPRREPPTAPSLLRSIPLDPSSLSLVWDAPNVVRRSPRAVAALALVAGLIAGTVVHRQWFAPGAHAETPACPVVACKVPEPTMTVAGAEPAPLCSPSDEARLDRARPQTVRARRRPMGQVLVMPLVDTKVPISPPP